jgi:hypothetical protein
VCTFTHALQNRSIIQELSPLQPSSVQCILYCEGVCGGTSRLIANAFAHYLQPSVLSTNLKSEDSCEPAKLKSEDGSEPAVASSSLVW